MIIELSKILIESCREGIKITNKKNNKSERMSFKNGIQTMMSMAGDTKDLAIALKGITDDFEISKIKDFKTIESENFIAKKLTDRTYTSYIKSNKSLTERISDNPLEVLERIYFGEIALLTKSINSSIQLINYIRDWNNKFIKMILE